MSTNLGATPAFNRPSLKLLMDTTTEISMYKPFVSYFIYNAFLCLLRYFSRSMRSMNCCPELLLLDIHSHRFPTYEHQEISQFTRRNTISQHQQHNRSIDQLTRLLLWQNSSTRSPTTHSRMRPLDLSMTASRARSPSVRFAHTQLLTWRHNSAHTFSHCLSFPSMHACSAGTDLGVIVTGGMDFENGGASLLADFLWRYQNLTSAEKGYDEGITPVAREQVERIIPDAVAKLGANNDAPFFSVRFPDNSNFS